jgi:hypothetical protein
MIGAGDYLQAQVNYSVGAVSYISNSAGLFSRYNGNSGFSYGLLTDNVIDSTGSNNQTTGWGFNAAYEHYWNKSFQTSVYTGYQSISYNSSANAALCAGEAASFGLTAATFAPTCNNNFKIWNIGSRTQWNIDSQTAMGVDILYSKLQSASSGTVTGVTGLANGSQPAGVRTIGDQGSWMGQFRIHRNFYP